MKNPHDTRFKHNAEADIRGLLHLFARILLEEAVEVELVERELVADALYIDHACRVRTAAGETIVHFEIWTEWRAFIPEKVTDYAGTLCRKFGLPVRPIVLVKKGG